MAIDKEKKATVDTLKKVILNFKLFGIKYPLMSIFIKQKNVVPVFEMSKLHTNNHSREVPPIPLKPEPAS